MLSLFRLARARRILGPTYVLLIVVAHSDVLPQQVSLYYSCYLFKRRQNLLAECLNEAELPPSYLMEMDFGEPHRGILRKPRDMLSQIGRNKDGLPYVFPLHETSDGIEVLRPAKIPVQLSACCL
jgi:hypothetical protein